MGILSYGYKAIKNVKPKAISDATKRFKARVAGVKSGVKKGTDEFQKANPKSLVTDKQIKNIQKETSEKHIKRVRKEYLREKKAFGGLLSKTKKKPETKEQKSIKEKILPKKKKDRLEELRKELGMKKGGSALKPVDKQKNPGLAKLPTQVRNKMGYMKKGGSVKQMVKTVTSPITHLRNKLKNRKFGRGKK